MVSKIKKEAKLIEMVNILSLEKGVDKEVVIEALEEALSKAYEKTKNFMVDAAVTLDAETGKIRYYHIKEVVDKEYDEETEISLKKIQKYDPDAEIGDSVHVLVREEMELTRIAAQACKQVFGQKLRNEEKTLLYNKYIDKKGEIMYGKIQRKIGNTYFLNLEDGSKIDVVLAARDQIKNENYSIGQRIMFYIVDIRKDEGKSARIIASRTNHEFVRKLFEREISEVFEKVIEIVDIARDPGSRCKIGVLSHDSNVDAVGTCVGNKGNKIQNIVKELNNEKIDVIPYDNSPEVYIKNSLKPAQVESVTVNLTDKAAIVVVPKEQYSLAIGRKGQNVRLAAKLTGYKIDVKTENVMTNEQALKDAEALFNNENE